MGALIPSLSIAGANLLSKVRAQNEKNEVQIKLEREKERERWQISMEYRHLFSLHFKVRSFDAEKKGLNRREKLKFPIIVKNKMIQRYCRQPDGTAQRKISNRQKQYNIVFLNARISLSSSLSIKLKFHHLNSTPSSPLELLNSEHFSVVRSPLFLSFVCCST